MKRTIIGAIIIFSLVILIWLGTLLFSIETGKVDDSCFTLKDNRIIDYDSNCGDFVVIPSTINDIEIKTIDEASFSTKGLKKIEIEDGIEIIGVYAFANNDIEELKLPTTIKEIQASAFYDNKLEELTIPETITLIEERAFNKNNLKEEDAYIYFPTGNGFDTKTLIGYGGSNKDVILPENVTSIFISAFADNELTSIILHDNVLRIQESAFENNNINTITLPSSIKQVGNDSFKNNPISEIKVLGKTDISEFEYFDNDLEQFISY